MKLIFFNPNSSKILITCHSEVQVKYTLSCIVSALIDFSTSNSNTQTLEDKKSCLNFLIGSQMECRVLYNILYVLYFPTCPPAALKAFLCFAGEVQ